MKKSGFGEKSRLSTKMQTQTLRKTYPRKETTVSSAVPILSELCQWGRWRLWSCQWKNQDLVRILDSQRKCKTPTLHKTYASKVLSVSSAVLILSELCLWGCCFLLSCQWKKQDSVRILDPKQKCKTQTLLKTYPRKELTDSSTVPVLWELCQLVRFHLLLCKCKISILWELSIPNENAKHKHYAKRTQFKRCQFCQQTQFCRNCACEVVFVCYHVIEKIRIVETPNKNGKNKHYANITQNVPKESDVGFLKSPNAVGTVPVRRLLPVIWKNQDLVRVLDSQQKCKTQTLRKPYPR
jgi:hypothetical protein